MLTLLEETAHYAPVNIAIGVAVFCLLLAALSVVIGFGSSRPHS